MGRAAGQSDDVHQHSGWLIPAGFFCAILVLSGLFLAWYLRPGPRGAPAPTAQSNTIALTVRGLALAVPANYIDNPRARRGGAQDSLTLAALFPGLEGWSEAKARLFAVNAPDSPVIRIALRGDTSKLDAPARLARLYRPYIANGPAPGPFGLSQYGFAKNSGYERSDLFSGQSPLGLVLLLCEKPAPDLPSPNCIAVDRPLDQGVSYSVRFKRAWLARWPEMTSGVHALVTGFVKR